MAKKKLGKFLAFTAIIGTAAAAGTAYFMKKMTAEDCSDLDYDDYEDDLDDEDFDFPTPDQTETSQREYVSLNLETPKQTTDDSAQETPISKDSKDTSLNEENVKQESIVI